MPDSAPTGSKSTEPAQTEIVLDSDEDAAEDSEIDLESSENNEEDDCVVIEEHDTSSKKRKERSRVSGDGEDLTADSEESSGSGEDSDFDVDDENEDDEEMLIEGYNEGYTNFHGVQCFDLTDRAVEDEIMPDQENVSQEKLKEGPPIASEESHSTQPSTSSQKSSSEATENISEAATTEENRISAQEMEVDGSDESEASTSSESSSSESDSEDEEAGANESDSEPEVVNPFINFKAGAACSELEDQKFLTLYKELKECYDDWKADVNDTKRRDLLFDKIHSCVMQPSYRRLTKDENTFQWPRFGGVVDKVNLKDKVLCAFCHIRKLLAKIDKNPVPHLYQMLMITPHKQDLWIRLAKSAARRSDIKTASVACENLRFLGEGRKAHERMIVMYYGLCRFPECLLAIKKVLSIQPDNQIALVLLDRMLNCSIVMKDAVEKVMYENQISKEQFFKTNEVAKQKVLRMVQKFRAKIVPAEVNSRDGVLNSGSFYEVTLDEDDHSFGRFGLKLKKIYDELPFKLSTRVSFIYRPPEVFYESDEGKRPSRVPTPASNSQPDVEMSLSSSEETSEDQEVSEVEVEDLQDEETIKKLMDDLLDWVEEEEMDVPSVVTVVDAASEESEASIRNFQEVGDENEPPPKKKQKAHAFATRRSTRHVEEIEDCPFTSMPLVLETYDIRKCLKVDKDGELQFSGSSKNYYLKLKAPSFTKNTRSFPAELNLRRFLNGILDEMDKSKANGLFFVSILDRFLSFVAEKALENGILFSKEDRTLFCELYELWKQLRSQSSKKKRSRNPFQIHLLATEFADQTAVKSMDLELGRAVRDEEEPTSSSLCPPWFENSMEFSKDVKDMEKFDTHKVLVSAHKSILKWKLGLYSNVRYQQWKSKMIVNNEKPNVETPTTLKSQFVELGGDESTEFDVSHISRETVFTEPWTAENEADWTDISKTAELRYHWTRALQHRFLPITEGIGRKFQQKQEQYHLLRIFQLLDEMSVEEKDQISSMKSYFNPTTAPVNGDFNLETALRRLIQNYKLEKDNLIMFLISQKALSAIGDKDKIVDTVWHYFDWSVLEAADKFDCWRMVFNAFSEKKAVGELFKMAMSGLEDILQKKPMTNQNSLEVIDFFLEQIEQNLNEISQHDPTQLKLLLIELSEKFNYRANLRLWRVIFKVAQLQDPKTPEELAKFVEETKFAKDRMPLISLMVLKNAHESLGQERRCGAEEGQFLLFCLEEFTKTIQTPLLQDFLAKGTDEATEVKVNLEREILQFFSCYTGQIVRCRLRLKEHSQNEKRSLPPFRIVQQILQLILPKELPVFDDQMTLKSEVMEFVKIVQTELESPFSTSDIEKFDEFVHKNVHFKPIFKFESDGTLLPISSMFEDRNLTAWPRISMDKERAIVTSKSLYLSAFYQYRSTGRDLKNTAYQILMISEALTPELQSSVWIMLAKSSVGSVEDFVKDVDAILYPFRMSLLLKVDCAEAHLDLGSIMYQVHAIENRKMRVTTAEPEKKRLMDSTFDLIRTCRTHFLLADRFKTQAIDIGWLCCYFSGKVSEKLHEPIDVVMDHYTECAVRMHDDQYMFLNKISKKNQSNLEPLELFYRVHSYLAKRFFENKRMNKRSLNTRRKILHYLQYFSTYGVSKAADSNVKNSVLGFFSTLPTVYDTMNDLVDDITNSVVEDEIQGTLGEMTEWIEIEERAKTLFKSAYESILAKFPHYKAAHRLAEIHLSEGCPSKCMKTMMEHVFKGHKRINANVNIFQNITDIQRSDFERGTSLNYHICRCLDLFFKALMKIHDLGHVIVALHSLSNPAFSATSYLSQEVINQKIVKCLVLIKNLLVHPRAEWGSHFEQYELILQSCVSHIAKAGIKVDPALATRLADLLGKARLFYRNAKTPTSTSRVHSAPRPSQSADKSTPTTTSSNVAKAENVKLLLSTMKQLRSIGTPLQAQQELITLLEKYSNNNPKVFEVLLNKFVEHRFGTSAMTKRPIGNEDQSQGGTGGEPPKKMAKKDTPSTSGLTVPTINVTGNSSTSTQRTSPKSPIANRLNGSSTTNKASDGGNSDDIEILEIVTPEKQSTSQNETPKSSSLKPKVNGKEAPKQSTSHTAPSQTQEVIEAIKQTLLMARNSGTDTWNALVKSPMMQEMLKLPQTSQILRNILAAENAKTSTPTTSSQSSIQRTGVQVSTPSSSVQDASSQPARVLKFANTSQSVVPPKKPEKVQPVSENTQPSNLASQMLTNGKKNQPSAKGTTTQSPQTNPSASLKTAKKAAPSTPQTTINKSGDAQSDIVKTDLYEKIRSMTKEQRQSLRNRLDNPGVNGNEISADQERQLRRTLALFDVGSGAAKTPATTSTGSAPLKNTQVPPTTPSASKSTPVVSTPKSVQPSTPTTLNALKIPSTPKSTKGSLPSPTTIQNLQNAFLAFQSLGNPLKRPATSSSSSIFKSTSDKNGTDKEFWENFQKMKEAMNLLPLVSTATAASSSSISTKPSTPTVKNAGISKFPTTPSSSKASTLPTTSSGPYKLKPTNTIHSMASILGNPSGSLQSQAPKVTMNSAMRTPVSSTTTPAKPKVSTPISTSTSVNNPIPLAKPMSTPTLSMNKTPVITRKPPQAATLIESAKASTSKAPPISLPGNNINMDDVMKLCIVMQKPMDKWTKEDATLVQSKLPEFQRQFLEASVAGSSGTNGMLAVMQQLAKHSGTVQNDKKKADEEKLRAEKALKQKLELAEKMRKEQELKKKQEEDRKRQMLEEFRKKEEEKRQRLLEEKAAKEAEKKRKLEEERQRKLAEKQAEQDRRAAEKQAELDRKRQQAEAERHRRAEEERQRQEERRRQIEAAEKIRAEEERRRIEEEQRRLELARRQREVEDRRKMMEEEARAVESMKSLIDDDQRSNYTDDSESFEEDRRRQREEERKRAVEMERLKTLEKRKLINERIHRENAEKQRQVEEQRRVQEQRIREQRQKEETERRLEEEARKKVEMEQEAIRRQEHVEMLKRVKTEEYELTFSQRTMNNPVNQGNEYSHQQQQAVVSGNGSGNSMTNAVTNSRPVVVNQSSVSSENSDDFLGSFLSEQLKRDEQEREQRLKSKKQSQTSPSMAHTQQSPSNQFYGHQNVIQQGPNPVMAQQMTSQMAPQQVNNPSQQFASNQQVHPNFNNQPQQSMQTQGFSPNVQQQGTKVYERRQIRQPSFPGSQMMSGPQQGQMFVQNGMNNMGNQPGLQQHPQASNFGLNSERSPLTLPKRSPINPSSVGSTSNSSHSNVPVSPLNPNPIANNMGRSTMNAQTPQYGISRPQIQRQQAVNVESPKGLVPNSPQFGSNSSPYQNQRRPSWSNNSFENQKSPYMPQNPMMLNITNSMNGNPAMPSNQPMQQIQRQMSNPQVIRQPMMSNNMPTAMSNFPNQPMNNTMSNTQNSQTSSQSSSGPSSQPFSTFMRQAVGVAQPMYNNTGMNNQSNMTFSAGMNMPVRPNMNNPIPQNPSNMQGNANAWNQGRNTNYYQNYYG